MNNLSEKNNHDSITSYSDSQRLNPKSNDIDDILNENEIYKRSRIIIGKNLVVTSALPYANGPIHSRAYCINLSTRRYFY